MAEFVQQRSEQFVPIVEHLNNQLLFTSTESRKFLAEVQVHEYKIQKGSRKLDDLLGFVDFLVKWIEAIKIRRKEHQNFKKSKEIDYQLKQMIYSLFGQYKRNFKSELKYWQAYIYVLLKLKSADGQLSRLFVEMTTILGGIHSFVWRQASEFHYTCDKGGPMDGIQQARAYLQKCIRIFPNNISTYLWAFELELKHEEFLSKEKEKLELAKKRSKMDDYDYEKGMEDCRKASETLFSSAKENCWAQGVTVEVYRQFLGVAHKYPRFKLYEEELKKALESNCSTEEETYDFLATLAFQKDDVENGLAFLNKGLKMAKTMKMYDIVTKILTNLIKTKPTAPIFKRLLDILKQGQNNDLLTPSCYVKWIELPSVWKEFQETHITKKSKPLKTDRSSNFEEIPDAFRRTNPWDIIEIALKKYPDNVDLVTAKLKLMSENENTKPSEIMKILEIISEERRDEVYHHICKGIFVSAGVTREGKKDKFFNTIILKCRDRHLKDKLQAHSIEFSYLKCITAGTGALANARTKFAEINDSTPSYPAFKSMAKIEFRHIDLESKDPCKRLREVMELACISYGSKMIEVWLDYIDFENKLGNSQFASILRGRAMTYLPEKLQKSFILKEMAIAKQEIDRMI